MKKATQPVENSQKTVEKPVDNNVDNPVDNATAGLDDIIDLDAAASADSSHQATLADAVDQSAAAPAPDPRVTEYLADLQRTRADFENFRKQTELQKSQAMSAARYATVERFLPLIDDFSRAIATYPDQLQPLAKSLQKLLVSLQLSVIDSVPGTEFNPDFHEAISVEDGDGATEVITETLRPGYIYEGVVIRPAMVKVAR